MDTPTPGESTHTIIYDGATYTVPDWVCFVATNRNGRVTGFESEPHANAHSGTWVTSMEYRRHILARDNPEADVKDWSLSLVTLPGPEESRAITYRGREYQVPRWARYVACDWDGDVGAYEILPEQGNGRWANRGHLHSLSRKIGSTGRMEIDWMESLMEIPSDTQAERKPPQPAPEHLSHDVRAVFDQVNKRRAQLEREVMGLISVFELETGVTVRAIDIYRNEDTFETESGERCITRVTASAAARLTWSNE